MKALIGILCLMVATVALAELPPVQAMCTCPCPSTPPWVKVDGLTSTTYTFTPPECKRVTKVCYKSSTSCKDYSVTEGCGAPVTVTSQVFNQNGQRQALSHASFLLENCCTTTPTPTKTKTPPPDTPTPTPTNTPPTPTSTPTPPPDTPTPTPTATPEYTPTPCPPIECGNRCGTIYDACGQSLECGLCPPPPPPPKRWPTPDCDECVFPKTVTIHAWRAENVYHAEWFHFYEAMAIRQVSLTMYDEAEYRMFAGPKDPYDSTVRWLDPTFKGPGTVVLPIPLAGLPVQEFTYLSFVGGQARMTIWVDTTNQIFVRSEEAVVSVSK